MWWVGCLEAVKDPPIWPAFFHYDYLSAAVAALGQFLHHSYRRESQRDVIDHELSASTNIIATSADQRAGEGLVRRR